MLLSCGSARSDDNEEGGEAGVWGCFCSIEGSKRSVGINKRDDQYAILSRTAQQDPGDGLLDLLPRYTDSAEIFSQDGVCSVDHVPRS